MEEYIFQNGDKLELKRNDDGIYACPICRCFRLSKPPYAAGNPSFEYCSACDAQIGWDDKIPHDAPLGSHEELWEKLRQLWTAERATKEELEESGLL